MSVIERSAGRSTFGGDPQKYDWARPPYPDGLYDILRTTCGLKAGTRTFEAGAGTGIATRRLLALGADLVAIEPDIRLAAYLESTQPHAAGQLRIEKSTFEDARLPEGTFDLGISATAFHWLEQAPSLAKAHRSLKPGGWWAMWWNHYGDPAARDAFDHATKHLFGVTKRSPSQGAPGGRPFDLDITARIADLAAAGFSDIRHETLRSTFTFETARLVALYGSFSVVLHLEAEARAKFLSDFAVIVDGQFGGRVERPLTTTLYMARRA